MQILLHTPEGVRDLYNEECEKKLILERKLRRVQNSYGYRDIETPTFEFFDVFGKDVGTIPSRELYKFFDREGNTLVLRPDFTPPIARAVAKYFSDEERPIRLCYHGNVFVNNSSYQGRLKESTELGAELIGDPSPEADAELIAMVIDMLLEAGLREFQISIGHVQYFECLAMEAGLDKDTREELKELIRNKNTFGVEKLLAKDAIRPGLKEAFAALPILFGGEEVLEKAHRLAEGTGAEQAILRLKEVLDILKIYGLDRYVSFDLGMLSSYMYYTGILFRGYTYGTGEAVIKGGRYDDLLRHFGKEAPSIGFVVVLHQLMNAMARQKIEIPREDGRYLILYRKKDREEALRTAMDYRREGRFAELLLVEEGKEPPEDSGYSSSGNYIEIIRIGDL